MEGIENNQMPLAHCDHVLKTVLCHAVGSVFIQSLQIEMPNLKDCCLNMMKLLSETNLEAEVMVSQKSSEWHEMRRFRISG
jgi:hypothetical protein